MRISGLGFWVRGSGFTGFDWVIKRWLSPVTMVRGSVPCATVSSTSPGRTMSCPCMCVCVCVCWCPAPAPAVSCPALNRVVQYNSAWFSLGTAWFSIIRVQGFLEEGIQTPMARGQSTNGQVGSDQSVDNKKLLLSCHQASRSAAALADPL